MSGLGGCVDRSWSQPGDRLTDVYEGVVQDLIDELGRLPGVGPKGAQRIAFHLLQADAVDVKRLVTALVEVKEKVRFCSICGNVAEAEQCRICLDPRRDLTCICVVEEPKDVVAVASPSRLGSVAMMISMTSASARRVNSSLIRRSSGPTPSIGLIAPPSTW